MKVRSIKYCKLKFILNKYLNGFKRRDQIVDKVNNITKDNVQDSITIFKKAGILQPTGISGENTLKQNLIDDSVFHSKNYNNIIISSIAHSQDESASEVINYIFKDISNSTSKSKILKYQKRFDENLIRLIDSTKYQTLLRIIEDNQLESTKLLYNVMMIDHTKYDLIPLDIVILDDSWYLFSFDTRIQKYRFDDSKEIKKLKYLNDIPFMYEKKQIEDEIDNFLKNTRIFDIEVRLTAEVLNNIIRLNLVEDYDLYEDTDDESEIFLKRSFGRTYKSTIKLTKIKTYTDDLRLNFSFEKSVNIHNQYRAILKIKKVNMEALISLYPNIFVNKNFNSNVIRFCKYCNSPISRKLD